MVKYLFNGVGIFVIIAFSITCSEAPYPPIFKADFYETAVDLTEYLDVDCFTEEYKIVGTTNEATADRKAGSCSDKSHPVRNVWYKFFSQSSQVSIHVFDPGTNSGPEQYKTTITLWSADENELKCVNYDPFKVSGPFILDYGSLEIGAWYYISIDAQCELCGGSFAICIDDN